MSKKIKDFLNILEQKDAYVESSLSDSKDISAGLIQYGNDVNMAFFSQESSQNLNYEKIKK